MKGTTWFFALLINNAASSSFGVTHVTYNEYVLQDSNLETIHLLPHPNTGDPKGTMKRHSMTCSRLCATNARCSSSYASLVFHEDFVNCYLLASNLCSSPTSQLVPIPGTAAKLYDKIQDSVKPVACNEICIVKNPGDCSACQRPSCVGSRCETCSQTCLSCYSTMYPNTSRKEEVECILWLGLENMYKTTVHCLGEKVLLFHRFNFPNGTSEGVGTFAWSACSDLIHTMQKFLYIELFMESSSSPSYTATYSGLNCFINRSISLEAWVNGSALDGLGVPIFSSDPFVEDTTMYHPSCGPFWNRQASNLTNYVNETAFGFGPCPGLSTAFFGTPNVTSGIFTSGIAWATLPSVQLIGVKIYMY